MAERLKSKNGKKVNSGCRLHPHPAPSVEPELNQITTPADRNLRVTQIIKEETKEVIPDRKGQTNDGRFYEQISERQIKQQ